MANMKRESNVSADSILEARTMSGLSQIEVAKLLRVSHRTYRYWEKGIVKMREETFQLMVSFCSKGKQ